MATATSILTGDIMGKAKVFREARSQFDEEFMDWARGIPPMAPERFWPRVAEFRKVVMDTMRYTKESVGEKAANEYLRQAAVEGGNLAAAIHFALSWSHYKRQAWDAGDEAGFSFQRGDDGYGDLMDALPLLGKSIVVRLGKFRSHDEFTVEACHACNALTDGEAGRAALKQLVLHGENYFSMSLEEAAQKWVVIESRNQ
jgi:hypothetical protein